MVQRPVSPERELRLRLEEHLVQRPAATRPTFDDVPGGRNDDDASVSNLFVSHNRMHDWSYYLGLHRAELQHAGVQLRQHRARRGRTTRRSATPGGRRTFNGRDNANQMTLQDGIAPITNQYLWQPLAGAFYAACTDGAYDMAVVAHEYGHAISNRMVAGPDTGTGATQGQTESWSDLIFSEYFRGKGISHRTRCQPVRAGAVRLGQQAARHPQLRHERQPAQLLRPGVRRQRHHLAARRRRDLERHQLRHRRGAQRQVRRRSSRRPTRACS